MKRINFLFLPGLTIILSIFFLSSSGWAQTTNPKPLRQYLAKVGQKVRQAERAPALEQDRIGDMRIDWKELDLSEEQKITIQQKRREFQVQTADIRAELRFAQKDLQAEIRKETTDQSKIENLLSDMSAMSLQLSEAAVQNILAIKETLTPDQLEKLQELRSRIPAELERLRPTAEQRERLQDIVKSSSEEVREVKESLRELKAQLHEMLLAPDVDSEELNQLQAEVAEVELTQRELQVEMLLQLKEILTPEQLKLWRRPGLKGR